jgi:hypothetical protein
MFELLAGIPPFIGPTINDVYNRIKEGNIRFPGFMSDKAKDLISVSTML